MRYIGQTTLHLHSRRAGHMKANHKFSRALRKNPDAFKWIVLAKCKTKEELNELEIQIIKDLQTLHPNGYNLTAGGQNVGVAGYQHTKETKAKISAARKGKTLSKETRAKVSASLKGRKNEISEETRAKLSKASTGKTHTDETKAKLLKIHLGSKRSTETRQKMSEAQKKRRRKVL